MSPLELIALALAAASAGAVNAIGGGGQLITFPALIAVGYPAKVANYTSTVAVWPGTIGGSFAYREELRERSQRLLKLLPVSMAGALTGAGLLILTPQTAFAAVVPWLIYFACALLAFQSRLSRLAAHRGLHGVDETSTPLALQVGIFVIAVYGGYFGAGIGILMLALIGILTPDTLHHANAVKGMLALAMNFVALVAYALFAEVAWLPAAVMAVAAILGGYAGVRVARRVNPVVLRIGIVAYGLVVATVLLLR